MLIINWEDDELKEVLNYTTRCYFSVGGVYPTPQTSTAFNDSWYTSLLHAFGYKLQCLFQGFLFMDVDIVSFRFWTVVISGTFSRARQPQGNQPFAILKISWKSRPGQNIATSFFKKIQSIQMGLNFRLHRGCRALTVLFFFSFYSLDKF